MKSVALALIYIAFFALIGISLYITKNPHVLWALVIILFGPLTTYENER